MPSATSTPTSEETPSGRSPRASRSRATTTRAHESFRKATTLLEEQGHRRDYVEAYRAWGKFLRRSGREDEALEVLERAADLAAEPVAADHRGKR